MKRLVAVVVVFFFVASVSQAGIISLAGGTLDTLLGTGASAVDPAALSAMEHDGTTLAEVTNQAYVNSSGSLWAYLYQVENMGPTAIQMFTLWPFVGADSDTTLMGWLTDVPAGGDFVIGGQLPEITGHISSDPSGPVITFQYSAVAGNEIDYGEKSAVMYVLSNKSPGMVNGNVIGGMVGSGLVVGVDSSSVPEPATAIYLILGGLSLLGFYPRRKN